MHTHQLTDYKTAALSQRRCHARRRAGCIQVCTLPPSLASSQYSHFPQVLSSRPHGARSAATTRRGRHNNAQTAWRAAGVGESIRRADKGVLTPFRRVNTHLWHRSTRALHANAARPDVRHTAQERRRTSTRRRRPLSLCTPRNRQLTHALYGSRYVYPRLTRTVYEGLPGIAARRARHVDAARLDVSHSSAVAEGPCCSIW